MILIADSSITLVAFEGEEDAKDEYIVAGRLFRIPRGNNPDLH